jgi:hypothetical protein
MRYLMLRSEARAELFRELETMPDFLMERFASLNPEQAAAPDPRERSRPSSTAGTRPTSSRWDTGRGSRGSGRRSNRSSPISTARESPGSGITLCDLPSMMAEHDASHRAEIREWEDANGYLPR